MSVDWDEWNAGGGPRYPHEKVVQWVLRTAPPSRRDQMRALDLGCGSGVHAAFLAHEGFDVTAIDVSAVGVDNTRSLLQEKGLRAETIVSDISTIDLPSRWFDLAICVGVLECLEPSSAAKAVGAVSSALREGGKGFFLFASERDYRTTGENPWQLHGFSREEVDEVFAGRFASVWIDNYITTYSGGAVEQNDWLVTVAV